MPTRAMRLLASPAIEDSIHGIPAAASSSLGLKVYDTVVYAARKVEPTGQRATLHLEGTVEAVVKGAGSPTAGLTASGDDWACVSVGHLEVCTRVRLSVSKPRVGDQETSTAVATSTPSTLGRGLLLEVLRAAQEHVDDDPAYVRLELAAFAIITVGPTSSRDGDFDATLQDFVLWCRPETAEATEPIAKSMLRPAPSIGRI